MIASWLLKSLLIIIDQSLRVGCRNSIYIQLMVIKHDNVACNRYQAEQVAGADKWRGRGEIGNKLKAEDWKICEQDIKIGKRKGSR